VGQTVANETGFLAYVVAAREVRSSNTLRKCLLLYYASNVNNTGSFYKSFLTASLETCIPVSTIQRLNDEWQTAGILTWASGTADKPNTYQLHLPKLREYVESSKTGFERRQKVKLEKAAARSKAYRERRKKSQ